MTWSVSASTATGGGAGGGGGQQELLGRGTRTSKDDLEDDFQVPCSFSGE